MYFLSMEIILDKKLCVGCGLCEENMPEIFEIGDYTAELKKSSVEEELRAKIAEIIEDCPADAITIS